MTVQKLTDLARRAEGIDRRGDARIDLKLTEMTPRSGGGQPVTDLFDCLQGGLVTHMMSNAVRNYVKKGATY